MSTRKREERRLEIFDAASELFYERGYEGTSLQDIADQVGLLKGSLYHYIRSKEDLLFEIVMEISTTATASVPRIETSGKCAIDRISRLVDTHIGLLGHNYRRTRVFFTEANNLSPERFALVVAERDRYQDYFRGLIEAGKREGDIRAPEPPAVLAVAYLTMMNSICLWYSPEGPLAIDDISAAYRGIVLRSLCHGSAAATSE